MRGWDKHQFARCGIGLLFWQLGAESLINAARGELDWRNAAILHAQVSAFWQPAAVGGVHASLVFERERQSLPCSQYISVKAKLYVARRHFLDSGTFNHLTRRKHAEA